MAEASASAYVELLDCERAPGALRITLEGCIRNYLKAISWTADRKANRNPYSLRGDIRATSLYWCRDCPDGERRVREIADAGSLAQPANGSIAPGQSAVRPDAADPAISEGKDETAMEQTKTCRKCRETKPLDEFSKDRRRQDGRGPICKSCHMQLCREYRRRKKARGNGQPQDAAAGLPAGEGGIERDNRQGAKDAKQTGAALYIPFEGEADARLFDALERLARRMRRSPEQQALWILEEHLTAGETQDPPDETANGRQ